MNHTFSVFRHSDFPLTAKARLLFLGASGVMAGLCVTFSLGLLQWLSLVPVMFVLLRMAHDEAAVADGKVLVRLRRIYALGLYFFMCYYLVCFHWFLYMYPLEFVGLERPAALFVVLFAWWGLSLLQASVGALIFVAFVAMTRKLSLLRRFPMLQTVLLPVLWVVFEWSQTIGWTGVPWGRLAIGQVGNVTLLQTASLFGSYAISFVVLFVNAALAYCMVSGNKIKLCCGAVAMVLAISFSFGFALRTVSIVRDEQSAELVKVAAIQGNIGSADKWDVSSEYAWNVYFDLTEAAARDGAKLIVWPETAIPTTFFRVQPFVKDISSLAGEYGICVLIGTFTVDEYGDTYNSIVTVLPDGSFSESVYSKRHLVPFGEYVPMRDIVMTFIPALGQLSRFTDTLSPGQGTAIVDTPVGRIGSLICFDSIYEQLSLDSVRDGAQLLAVSTNDSWFFDSAAARMHNAQAQLRAVETGRCIIRAANTGISSVISSRGELLSTLPALQDGVLTASITQGDHVTLYTRIGNLFVYLCMSYSVGLVLCEVLSRRKNKRTTE